MGSHSGRHLDFARPPRTWSQEDTFAVAVGGRLS
jgi:hypothetical protein